MGAQENVELVKRGYAAFSAGDMATLNDLFADDAVWNSAGSGVMSGPKQGRGAILAYFGELMTRSGGTFGVNLLDIVGGDEHVFALQHSHAEREGKVIDQNAVNVFHIVGGVVQDVQDFYRDTKLTDDFWL
jgi:ketosteroid isomerase-like protein